MTNLLFDDKHRGYVGRSARSETNYSFMDRSALPNVKRMRELLEQWVSGYPDEKRKHIVTRMRRGKKSADQDQFIDVFFELFLHEFLLGTGGTVDVEPEIEGKTPDFAVSHDGSDYVVEATHLDFTRGGALQESMNEDKALDWLDTIHAPLYGLSVETNGVLENMVPKRKLLRPFEELVNRANYERLLSLESSLENLDEMPSAIVSHGSWELTGRLMPLRDEYHREFVMFGPSRGGTVNDIGKLRTALKRKANQCAGADNVIIAVQISGAGYRPFDVLFGTQTLNLQIRTATRELLETTPGQREDGFWIDQNGLQREHVIGVVFFDAVRPWALENATACFVLNPYVDTRLPKWTYEIDHVDFPNAEWTRISGRPPYKFLRHYTDIGDIFEGSPNCARFELP